MINHWIGGREHAAPADRPGDVYDPATGGRTAQVAFADPAVVDLFQHDVEVGMVAITVPIPMPMAFLSFGGWPDPSQRGVNLGFPQTH